MICNYLSVIIIFMLLFVSWKKGSNRWVKMAPAIYYVLTLTLFLFLPLLNILWTIYTVVNPNYNLTSTPS